MGRRNMIVRLLRDGAVILTLTLGLLVGVMSLLHRSVITNFTEATRYPGVHSEYETLRTASILNDYRVRWTRKKDTDYRIFWVGSSASRDCFHAEALREYFAARDPRRNVTLVRVSMDNAGAPGEALFVYNIVKYGQPDLILWAMMPPWHGIHQVRDSYVLQAFATTDYLRWIAEFPQSDQTLRTRLKQWFPFVRDLPLIANVSKMKLGLLSGEPYEKVLRRYFEERTRSEEEMRAWYERGNTTSRALNEYQPDGIGSRIYYRALAFLSEKNIPTLVFNIPVTEYFYNSYPTNTVAQFKQNIVRQARATNAIVVLETPDTMPAGCFYDPAHMNVQGRDKFTEILLSQLALASQRAEWVP